MKVCKYEEVEGKTVLPGVTKRVIIDDRDGAPTFCMRVFEVEPGSETFSHQHEWEHEIFVLAGKGVAVGEKGETPIGPGSVIFIPPNEYHCLKNTGDETFRIICLIPVNME